MNKNKKIISSALALALGISLIIPNAKANEEKTLEKALKEPVKTSEKEKPAEKQDKSAGGEEKPAEKQEKPADGQEKPKDNQTEKPKTDEVKPKEEKKVKPKEYKMSELLNEKGAFEKSKIANLAQLGVDITQSENNSSVSEEKVYAMRLQYIELEKATTWDEMGKILGYSKEHLARQLLDLKGEKDVYDPDLVKIIDDMANQKPQNPSPKNPIRKNKKTGTTNSQKTMNIGTTNSQKTINTSNKVNNAGVNVQTGVGSLSAILGLLGASSLGLFKSKRK